MEQEKETCRHYRHGEWQEPRLDQDKHKPVSLKTVSTCAEINSPPQPYPG